MKGRIADLYAQLKPDAARPQLNFSSEMTAAHDKMFAPGATAAEIKQALAEWLHRHQPCLFGRMSAKAGLVHYCVLTDDDLVGGDENIRDKIQTERTQWTREGFEGKKSGFIVLAVSRKLAEAAPDEILKQFAQRLCSLYLLEEEIEPDRIYLDEIFLENAAGQRTTWKWHAGVNVFSANGDRRWWQDHRIPGGLGFSVNSVGHLVKSKLMLEALQSLDKSLEVAPGPFATTKVTSLESALEFAMRTISNASEAVSGKATQLRPLPDEQSARCAAKCPVELPRFLMDKDYCGYQGYYHTDVTVPSDYFRPDVERPADIKAQSLDFTYLFNSHVDNPAFRSTAKGRRLRGGNLSAGYDKLLRGEPEELAIDASERLAKCLRLKGAAKGGASVGGDG
jgi:hypothetical protein